MGRTAATDFRCEGLQLAAGRRAFIEAALVAFLGAWVALVRRIGHLATATANVLARDIFGKMLAAECRAFVQSALVALLTVRTALVASLLFAALAAVDGHGLGFGGRVRFGCSTRRRVAVLRPFGFLSRRIAANREQTHQHHQDICQSEYGHRTNLPIWKAASRFVALDRFP